MKKPIIAIAAVFLATTVLAAEPMDIYPTRPEGKTQRQAWADEAECLAQAGAAAAGLAASLPRSDFLYASVNSTRLHVWRACMQGRGWVAKGKTPTDDPEW